MNREAESAATLSLFDSLFDNPALYLRTLDMTRGRVRFASMTEAAYARSPFLDRRLERISGREFGLDLPRLIEVYRRLHPPRRAMHYLFHIGHCGSTLLSRMLGTLSGVLSLREPPPLLELAQQKRVLDRRDSVLDEAHWKEAFELTMSLLSRTFGTQDVAFVKPGSHANNLIGDLLGWHPDCRAVLLYIDIEPYLATMLRPHTRTETQQAVEDSRLGDFQALVGSEERLELNDARKAALVWLVQMRELAVAAATFSGRVLAVEFDGFLANSCVRLPEIAAFLSRGIDAQTLDRVLDPATTGQYSKLTGQPYDAQARERMLDESRRAYGSEIAAGIQWAESICTRHGQFALLVKRVAA